MKHLTDANKDKLLAFLRSRPAAGEASLKSWGRDQRPQIPGVLVEEIADALVAEGKANDSRGVAAILGRSPGATNSDLRTLAERGLIERTAPGKYRAKEAA